MKRGFADFIGILISVLLGLVAVMIVINTAPTLGSSTGMLLNTTAGNLGSNQSAAAIAMYPQFSTLWVVAGLAVLLGILAAVFGKRG